MFGVSAVYPFGMNRAEYHQVNARFVTYARTKDQVVVGCIGSLRAEDLNRRQIAYIRCFTAAVNGIWKHEIAEDWPQDKIPRSNINNFLVFTKMTGHAVFHPDHFFYSHDVEEPCPHCGEHIPVRMDKDSMDDLEISCPVCYQKMMICTMCDRSPCDWSRHGGCKMDHDHARKENP